MGDLHTELVGHAPPVGKVAPTSPGTLCSPSLLAFAHAQDCPDAAATLSDAVE